jgi:hypothetical protein
MRASVVRHSDDTSGSVTVFRCARKFPYRADNTRLRQILQDLDGQGVNRAIQAALQIEGWPTAFAAKPSVKARNPNGVFDRDARYRDSRDVPPLQRPPDLPFSARRGGPKCKLAARMQLGDEAAAAMRRISNGNMGLQGYGRGFKSMRSS